MVVYLSIPATPQRCGAAAFHHTSQKTQRRMCADAGDKDGPELLRKEQSACVRACLTSEEESFAVVVKSRHLGNSIGGICQVKFTDDVNLVILIWSESQSYKTEEGGGGRYTVEPS